MNCWACMEQYDEKEIFCPNCKMPKEMPKPYAPEPKEEPKKKTLKEKLTGK